jgi:hypothetical protein
MAHTGRYCHKLTLFLKKELGMKASSIGLQDIVLWEEDEEEYLRKNLPSDLVCNFWCLLGFSDSCKSCSVLNSLFLLSLELFFGPCSLSLQISR